MRNYGNAFNQEDIVETINRLNNAFFSLLPSFLVGLAETHSRASFIETSLTNTALKQRTITKALIEREKGINFDALLNRIPNEETREFIRNIVVQLLENNPTKTVLDLWISNIGSDEFSVLLKAFEKNDYLQIMSLSCNPFRDEDVARLAKVIEKNQSLQILNLSNNSISNKGVAMLAEALRENQTLQLLNLSGNHIDDEGVKVLVQALKGNRSLYFLDLSNNDIRNAGAEALLKLLKRKLLMTSPESLNRKDEPSNRAVDSEVKFILRRFDRMNGDMISGLSKMKSTVEVITNQLQDLKQKLYPLDKFFSVAIERTSTRCSDYTEKAVENFEAYVSCLHKLMQQLTILGNMIDWDNRLAYDYCGRTVHRKRKQMIESFPKLLEDLLLNEFEDVLSAICSKYYHLYYKGNSALFNASNSNLARDIYKFWTRIFGEKCPKWIDNKAPQLITFYRLCALAEGQKEEPDTCCPPSVLLAKLKAISEKESLSELQSQDQETTS